MTKQERQAILMAILSEHQLSTQEELLAKLKENGVTATQATISRDIRELNIRKQPQGSSGKTIYVVPGLAASPKELAMLADIVQETVERISTVEFMVIIQTGLGSANRLAAKIDDLNLPEIAGTLAGANTLAIITSSTDDAVSLSQGLSHYLDN